MQEIEIIWPHDQDAMIVQVIFSGHDLRGALDKENRLYMLIRTRLMAAVCVVEGAVKARSSR